MYGLAAHSVVLSRAASVSPGSQLETQSLTSTIPVNSVKVGRGEETESQAHPRPTESESIS